MGADDEGVAGADDVDGVDRVDGTCTDVGGMKALLALLVGVGVGGLGLDGRRVREDGGLVTCKSRLQALKPSSRAVYKLSQAGPP